MSNSVEDEKRIAAQAAADLVSDGMRVGLGSGTTAAYLVRALASRALSIRCVATSDRTAQLAAELGVPIESGDDLPELDIAIDGADQVTSDGWLIKGGGGAHTREKIVAASADRFIVIVDSTKPVAALRPPVPLELLSFGLSATLRHLGTVTLRDVPPSPDGGVIADYHGDIGDPAGLAARLAATPGVIAHGLFEPALVSAVIIGRGDAVERRMIRT